MRGGASHRARTGGDCPAYLSCFDVYLEGACRDHVAENLVGLEHLRKLETMRDPHSRTQCQRLHLHSTPLADQHR